MLQTVKEKMEHKTTSRGPHLVSSSTGWVDERAYSTVILHLAKKRRESKEGTDELLGTRVDTVEQSKNLSFPGLSYL